MGYVSDRFTATFHGLAVSKVMSSMITKWSDLDTQSAWPINCERPSGSSQKEISVNGFKKGDTP